MKLKHRALALILTLMMVLTYMPAMAFAEDGDPIPIGVGDTKTVSIDAEHENYVFTFTPSESGRFVFYSIGDCDTFTEVYEEDDKLGEDDDSGEGLNFEYRFYAEQGMTYYLNASLLGSGTGNFEVSLGADIASEGEWWITNDSKTFFYEDGEDIVTLYADDMWSWTGDKPDITYQWYRDAADFDAEEYDWQIMEGEDYYEVDVPAENRYYSCVLTEEETGITGVIIYVVKNDGDDDDDDDYEFYFGDLPDDLDSINDIQLGKVVNASVNPDAPIVTYKFEAKEEGYYTYESYGTGDTVGQVRTVEDIIGQNDDGAENLNFKVTFWAEAGETYYLQARGYENEVISFQIKAAYFGKWYAYADYEDNTYTGKPVTLDVLTEGDVSNVKYNWYRYNTLIRANGGTSLDVAAGGKYSCVASDGRSTVKVDFYVYLEEKYQNNLRFEYEPYDDTVIAESYWDYNADVRATRGNITVPATMTFADGIARTVTHVDIYAPEMTSVNIPATVRVIEPGLGMSSLVWKPEDGTLASWTVIPGFVIYGKTGSAAQVYANKYRIPFRDLQAEAIAAAERARQGTPDSKIPKVKGLKKSAVKKTSITVKWTKLTSKQLKKAKATKYEIWVCPNAAFGAADTKIKMVSKSKSSAKITGLKKNTKYYVKVRAIRTVGSTKYVGKWSSRKTIKTPKK